MLLSTGISQFSPTRSKPEEELRVGGGGGRDFGWSTELENLSTPDNWGKHSDFRAKCSKFTFLTAD